MKQTLFALAIVFVLAGSALAGDSYVKGHYRDSDGDGYKETYVQPHYRSEPDGNRYNNYSTQGNTNPYTGRQGTESPDENTYRQNSGQYKSFYSK